MWPNAVAPYDAHVVVLPGAEEIALQAAEALSAAGLDVLLDDRDQRAGEKFADADLIGCPIRITAGQKSLEDGKVDVRDRASGDENRVDVADLGKEYLASGKATPIQRGRFGETVQRLMDEQGVTYRRLARTHRPFRRLPQPPRAREPARSLERRRGTLADALEVEPEHFREYRLRMITDRLEAMPAMIDRLYRQLNRRSS